MYVLQLTRRLQTYYSVGAYHNNNHIAPCCRNVRGAGGSVEA